MSACVRNRICIVFSFCYNDSRLDYYTNQHCRQSTKVLSSGIKIRFLTTSIYLIFLSLVGFSQITCRCGKTMCYVCRQPIAPNYQHFCQVHSTHIACFVSDLSLYMSILSSRPSHYHVLENEITLAQIAPYVGMWICTIVLHHCVAISLSLWWQSLGCL